MRVDEQRRLDRLMSGSPGPSVQEKEALLPTLLAQADRGSGPAPNRAWARWSLATAGAGVIGVLAALVFWWPIASVDEGAFTARGGAPAASAFELVCQPGPKQTEGVPECLADGLLAFKLSAPVGASYFSAAAMGPDDKLRYYFPTRTTGSLLLESDPLAARGAILGRDHPPGSYRVFGCFTAEPITPGRLRSAIESQLESGKDELKLIERGFRVVAP